MSWKLRHEGSPRQIEGLTLNQIVDGLQDGLWETTDEVMEDTDARWTAIENHPKLAEIAAEQDQLGLPREPPDETRLDMNPLIDVALVLLIFFILTTSYAAIQKVLEMPRTTNRRPGDKVTVVPKADVQKFTIQVQARMEEGKPVIRVEGKETDPKLLLPTLANYVSQTRKTEILIDAQGVEWGTVVAIQDAAKGAGVTQAHLVLAQTPSAKR